MFYSSLAIECVCLPLGGELYSTVNFAISLLHSLMGMTKTEISSQDANSPLTRLQPFSDSVPRASPTRTWAAMTYLQRQEENDSKPVQAKTDSRGGSREGPRPSPLYSDQTLETAPFPPPPIMSRSGPRTERYLKIMIIQPKENTAL